MNKMADNKCAWCGNEVTKSFKEHGEEFVCSEGCNNEFENSRGLTSSRDEAKSKNSITVEVPETISEVPTVDQLVKHGWVRDLAEKVVAKLKG